MNQVLQLNRKHRLLIGAPLLSLSKREIVSLGIELGVKYENTWTCYSNRDDGLADLTTPSSSLRVKGFIDCGYRDPIRYLQQDKLEEIYNQNNCRYINQ
jgi:7-cyano-7-deazaguanine synthase